ncbi:hypothetical protein [Pseudomonas sp. GV071]|uniref:hypothetical protein n=1 Tax=Pseudomonas sp. GV071 TaxID=2135754 RepID=UPI000D331BC3|nr:hypothetical protein [Pseudomonas sp. GV071]PTQ70384.1 hypothetical protein C8K61_106106 [Pseudomonas sp. GV071]
MIGRNDHLLKADDSAMLQRAMERFLAAGGAVNELPSGLSNPNPIAFIQPRIASAKARKSRAKPPEEKKPRRLSLSDLARQERDTKIAEMAKTMTAPEIGAELGLSRGTVVDIGRRRGFTFVPTPAIDDGEDAQYIERIQAMKGLGVTKTQCARKLDISLTKLDRLLAVGKIDYPTAGPGRPR